jgi:glutamine---fructose-6-phosphate transaminase (isomerizing)
MAGGMGAVRMAPAATNGHLGPITESEIRSMPAVWRRTLDRLDEEARQLAALIRVSSSITYVGCGSGHLAGVAAVELLRDAGVAAMSPVASDYVLRPPVATERDQRPLLVAFSRSGETTETHAALEAFRARTNGCTVAVTCRPGSALAKLSDRTVAIPEADERAVPQTRSVSAFLLFSVLVAARLAHADVRVQVRTAADALERRANDIWDALSSSSSAQSYALLGSGVGYPLATEAALKLTEMGQVPASAWRALEYRHGPIEALNRRTAVIGPLGVALDAAEDLAVRDAATRAASLVDPVALAGSANEPGAPLMQLYVLHALALLAARSRGRDADAPEQIRAFIDDVHLPIPEKNRT